MSAQRDTRSGSTKCFENGVLVLVDLGYRMCPETFIRCCKWCQKLAVRVTVFAVDVSLLNEFSVVISGGLAVSSDCLQMMC